MPSSLWPHQGKALLDAEQAIGEGVKRICVASPTGGGKTRIMQDLALQFLGAGMRVALYTNRRMLIDQLSENCTKQGIYHGIRAAGYPDEREHRFQICSIQTEHARCVRSQRWHLHDAKLVLVDEAHLHANDMAHAILGNHVKDGAFVVGFTATPVSLGAMYDRLIQAGTVTELFQCGALVPAVHYAPDEPDMKRLKGIREGQDLTEKQQRSAIMRPGLFGRIWDNYRRINPDNRPTICFGPDVEGSVWIAEQFNKQGVRAAHIDGENIWIDGEYHKSTRDLRQEILEESKNGKIRVLCNRFVLREGIDCPWLVHAIFACIFGSLQSYLQSGGRLLRAFPGLQFVTIQDHGGNWWRHGSLNEDRYWTLGDTGARLYGKRAERLRNGEAPEPFTCPRCGRVWAAGRRCSPARGGCGFEFPEGMKRTRAVVTEEGTLKKITGSIFRPRKTYTDPDGPAKWERMYHRARSKSWGASFRQAAAVFAQENGWNWPATDWPLMPTTPDDWFLKVSDVPMNRLTSLPERTERA